MALYHSVKGSVDYTTVGTPTIVDGIASGFSSSNYLQISQTYNATNNKNVEIYVRAKTPTTITSSFNPIFGIDSINIFGISSYSNLVFTIRMGYASGTILNFGDMYISGGVQADTWYRFKIKGSNGIWRAEIYNDSGALLNSSDKDWTSNTLNENYTIKLKCTDNTGVYSGAIDLKQTYIKIDGQPWFGVCPIEVKSHQIKGQVGYTVTGTPTIIDGIMSNFSNSNYATTTSTFEVANYDNVEIYVRAKTPVTTSAGWTDIIENGGVGNYRNLGAYANSELTSYYFNFFGYDFWRYNISADTWYRLKLTTTANTQSGYIYDDNGNLLYQAENWDRKIAGTSVLSFGGRYSPNKIGAIDFNNTYIKVNGQLWFWQPRPTQYIVKDGKLVWSNPSIYLQSDGNQYIDTGIIFKANTIFEVDAFFDNLNDNRWCGGTNYIIATNTNRFPTRISGQWYDDYAQAVTSGKHKILLSIASSSFQLAVDNIIQQDIQDISRTFLDDSSTFYIGKAHNGARGGLYGKSYGYKISQNGVLVRHFVPVPAGLVICNFTVPSNGMFDMVNQQFYANQGTGEFTIGKDS